MLCDSFSIRYTVNAHNFLAILKKIDGINSLKKEI
jgi:hypothetical protein